MFAGFDDGHVHISILRKTDLRSALGGCPNRLDCHPVPENRMGANLIHLCIWQLQARGELTALVAQIGESYKFIWSEEFRDGDRKPPPNLRCVIGELFHR